MAVCDTAAEPHTCRSAPCCNDVSRRRRDELDSGGTGPRAVVPATRDRDIAEQSASEATGCSDLPRPRTLERDGCGPAAIHRPTTRCEVMDATVALGTFEGVSGYSFHGNDLENVLPPTTAFHLRQASSAVHERNRTSPMPDKDHAAVQVATPSTMPQTRCEVLRLAESDAAPAHLQEHEMETISEDRSRLHSALQARCAKLLQQDHTYADIEKQLLPGMHADQCQL